MTNEINIPLVVTKLIGPIDPIGCSTTDKKRFKNLMEMIHLTEHLLGELKDVVHNKNSYEDSVKKIGIRAENFFKGAYSDFFPNPSEATE